MTRLLNILHSRQFNIDTLKSSRKGRSDCRKLRKRIKHKWLRRMGPRKNTVRLSEEDSNGNATVFDRSFVEKLLKKVKYAL